jgi:hypothetical protein
MMSMKAGCKGHRCVREKMQVLVGLVWFPVRASGRLCVRQGTEGEWQRAAGVDQTTESVRQTPHAVGQTTAGVSQTT